MKIFASMLLIRLLSRIICFAFGILAVILTDGFLRTVRKQYNKDTVLRGYMVTHSSKLMKLFLLPPLGVWPCPRLKIKGLEAAVPRGQEEQCSGNWNNYQQRKIY